MVLGVVAGFTLCFATHARAQAQFQAIPFVAGYYNLAGLGSSSDPDFQAEQDNSVALGLTLSVMFSDIFGAELSGAWSPSNPRLQLCDPGTGVCAFAPFNGSLILADLVAKYSPRRSNVFGIAGLGLVKRGGEAWEGTDGLTSFAGILGIGVVAQVAPKFALDVRAESFFYTFDPDGSDTDVFDSALAVDILVKIGVPIPTR
jgi:hypothetical protein